MCDVLHVRCVLCVWSVLCIVHALSMWIWYVDYGLCFVFCVWCGMFLVCVCGVYGVRHAHVCSVHVVCCMCCMCGVECVVCMMYVVCVLRVCGCNMYVVCV